MPKNEIFIPFTLPNEKGEDITISTSGGQLVVIGFIANDSSSKYVSIYKSRLLELKANFEAKGVRFIWVNSNDHGISPENAPDQLNAQAEEWQIQEQYLIDKGQVIAKKYGATRTPEFFVYDQDQKLRYQGTVDDCWHSPEKVRRRFLHDAINACLEQRSVPLAKTLAIGEAIIRTPRRSKS